jgi:hypothetical protein
VSQWVGAGHIASVVQGVGAAASAPPELELELDEELVAPESLSEPPPPSSPLSSPPEELPGPTPELLDVVPELLPDDVVPEEPPFEEPLASGEPPPVELVLPPHPRPMAIAKDTALKALKLFIDGMVPRSGHDQATKALQQAPSHPCLLRPHVTYAGSLPRSVRFNRDACRRECAGERETC